MIGPVIIVTDFRPLLRQLQTQIFVTFKIGIQSSKELERFDAAIRIHEFLYGSERIGCVGGSGPMNAKVVILGTLRKILAALQAVGHQH